jgi:gas vesicle protein
MNEEKSKKTEETKMVQKDRSRTAIAVTASLFSGLVVGFITGILFAPKKGKQTRKEITDKSKELYEKGKGTLTDTIDKTRDLAKESKSRFDKVVDIISPKKKNEEKNQKNP